MAAQILDGKSLAEKIQHEIGQQVADFILRSTVVPSLSAVLVGENPASQVYVRNKRKACERVGITSRLHRLPSDVTEDALLTLIEQLNQDLGVHGILVQLPLPSHIRETTVLDAVHPFKDVDAFHPENVGRVSQGRPRFLPCTPFAVQQILHRYSIPVAGKHVVVLGRSEIVGKPQAIMLMQRDSALGPSAANATVTVCHSQTPDLAEHTRRADILIAAIGKAQFVTAEMVKKGAVVIDVGINRVGGQLVGDVDFQSVKEIASYITPVPGGIGPLTVTMLLANTLRAAELQVGT